MTYFETWRTNLKDHLAKFASLAKKDDNIDLIFGLTAAAILWGVRDAPFNNKHRAALKKACNDEKHMPHLLRAIDGWDVMSPIDAARNLSELQSKDKALQSALSAVMGTFIDTLFAEKMIQQDITIEGNISGGNIIIGGHQIVAGDLIIRYIRQTVTTCPTAPNPPTHFTGRERELQNLRRKLIDEDMVAITAVQGMGGIGKTALAQALCHQPDKPFDAVLWATIGENPQATNILLEWARYAVDDYTLKPDTKPEEIAAWVRGQFTQLMNNSNGCGMHWLAVFDDVWNKQFCYDAVELLQTALPPGTKILITTRQAETATYLKARSIELYTLSNEEALDLLHKLRNSRHLSDAHLERTVALVKGHPLTLEIAISSLNNAEDAVDIETILDDYERGIHDGSPFDALNLGVAAPRMLNIVFGRSYNALSADDQAHFRALGILPTNAIWARSLAGALWEIEDKKVLIQAHKALRLISFIRQDEATEIKYTELYYRQHPLLRSYARALLATEGETDTIFNRYANHFIFLLSNYFSNSPFRTRQIEWESVDEDISHVVYLGNELLRITENGTTSNFLIHALAFGLEVGNLLRTHHMSLLDWMNMCLNATRVLQKSDMPYVRQGPFVLFNNYRHLEGLFLHSAAVGYGQLRDYHKAIEYDKKALAIFQEFNDRQFASSTMNSLARWQLEIESVDTVEETLKQAQETADFYGGFGNQAMTLNTQGLMLIQRDQPEQALPLFEQALRIAQSREDQPGIAAITNNIGLVWDITGDKKKALDYYLQAKALYETIHDEGGIAQTLHNAGNMYRQLGDYSNAIQCFEESISIYDKLENTRREIVTILPLLVDAYLSIDDLHKAIETLEQCVHIETDLQHQDLEQHRELLSHLRLVRDARLTPEQADILVENTFAALTIPHEQMEWRAELKRLCAQARAKNDLPGLQFFEALLQVMDGHIPSLPSDSPYARSFALFEELISTYSLLSNDSMLNNGDEWELMGLNEAQWGMDNFVEMYLQQGEEAVRIALKEFGVPDHIIEQLIARIIQKAHNFPQISTINTLPEETIEGIIKNTYLVKTSMPDELENWRTTLKALNQEWIAEGENYAIEVAFAESLLALLDDKPTSLPKENPYHLYLQQLLDALKQ